MVAYFFLSCSRHHSWKALWIQLTGRAFSKKNKKAWAEWHFINYSLIYQSIPRAPIPRAYLGNLTWGKFRIVGNLTQNFARQARHLTIEELLAICLNLNDFVDRYLTNVFGTRVKLFCFCHGILLPFRKCLCEFMSEGRQNLELIWRRGTSMK